MSQPNPVILPSALAPFKHIRAFDALAKFRYENIPLQEIQVYNAGAVNPALLYFLASGFGMLGYKGWFFADTEAKKRELIRQAILLKSKAGTPYAIKEAIRTQVGIQNVIIQERLIGLSQIFYDGTYNYNGSYSFGVQPWATFRVIIDITQTGPLSPQALADIRALILTWKNARSRLVDISLMVPNVEQVNIDDDDFVLTPAYSFVDGLGVQYNGLYNYDGTVNYNDGYDDDFVIIFGPLQTEDFNPITTEGGLDIYV